MRQGEGPNDYSDFRLAEENHGNHTLEEFDHPIGSAEGFVCEVEWLRSYSLVASDAHHT